jgi:DNA (cytosine-5)-methyltransferase 1
MKFSDNSLVIDLLLKSFDEAGYNIDYKELNAQNYGVPQFRERVFFIGVLKDLGIKPNFPVATHSNHIQSDLFFGTSIQKLRTFRDVCGQLESLESGEKSFNDIWHFAITHPKHVIEQLKDVPEGTSAHNNLNPALRPKSGYNTTYKRIYWDEPCSTISTTFAMISGSRNVHPTNTRSFTIREAMRVQTFPDDFKLLGTLGDIRTAIGNAVPPLFAKVLGEHIIANILNYSKNITSNLVQPTHKNSQLVS